MVIGDEADLHVHADVLVQVARGGVRLGTEHGGDLVHPLQRADHHLFIQLRRLREGGIAIKVAHGKEVRAALRRARNDLGRVNLGTTARGKRRPERAGHRAEDAERCRLRGVTQAHGGMVEKGIEVRVQGAFVDLERRLLRDGSEDLYRVCRVRVQLNAARRAFLRNDAARDRDHALHAETGKGGRFRRKHDLRDPCAVTYERKGHATEGAHRVQPPRYAHRLTDVAAEVCRQHARRRARRSHHRHRLRCFRCFHPDASRYTHKNTPAPHPECSGSDEARVSWCHRCAPTPCGSGLRECAAWGANARATEGHSGPVPGARRCGCGGVLRGRGTAASHLAPLATCSARRPYSSP